MYAWVTNGTCVILPVFIDDFTIVSSNADKITDVKNSLHKVFEIKDLGQTTYLLGIKVDYDQASHVLELLQHQYIIDMLHQFKLTNCNQITTPMEPGVQFSKALCPKTEEE